MSRWQAVLASALGEYRRLRVDRWDRALVSWWPATMLVIVAMTFASGVPRDLPIVVVDADRSATSRELVRRLDAAAAIRVAWRADSLDAAWSIVRRRQAWAVVQIPVDTAREIARGRTATIVSWFNASFPTAGQACDREVAAVVQSYAAERSARAGHGAGAPAFAVQATFLGNPQRSYEHFLAGLVFPALLHLAACLAMVTALGRELRDGTAAAWLARSGDRLAPALAGKLVPYVVLFTVYGVVATAWLDGVRGVATAGGVALLAVGHLLMYAAYGGIALLLVGATRNLGTALSLTGLYAGTSLAFSGATFPTHAAPLFTQAWTHAMPFTAYVALQVQQRELGAPWRDAIAAIATLLAFAGIAGAIGARLYARAARDPSAWGRR